MHSIDTALASQSTTDLDQLIFVAIEHDNFEPASAAGVEAIDEAVLVLYGTVNEDKLAPRGLVAKGGCGQRVER
ncbi:MAG: hypothetical protein ACI9OJ_004306 [Myxococcota bacterium]|jgi:hypothetical protein